MGLVPGRLESRPDLCPWAQLLPCSSVLLRCGENTGPGTATGPHNCFEGLLLEFPEAPGTCQNLWSGQGGAEDPVWEQTMGKYLPPGEDERLP